MSRSRSGDRTYTGHNGAREQALRDIDKLGRTPAGIASRLAAPSAAAIRVFIASQTCPWCGAGPYKVLALHTGRAHGVDRHEIRELAGLLKNDSVCDPDVSRTQADRLRGVALPPSAYDGRAHAKRREYSTAGLVLQQEKLAALDRDVCARVGAQASAAKTLAANAQVHSLIVQLYDDGLPMGKIAERAGVSKPTVSRVVRRAGRTQDGRTRRWESR